MKSNRPDEKRKALRSDPEWNRVLYAVMEKLYTGVEHLGLRDKVNDRLIGNSAKFAALAAVRAYKAINGNRAIVGDEIELCADIAIDILKHSFNPDRMVNKLPICVWDNISVLCGKCYIPTLVFTELYNKFGIDYTVMDLLCYREPDEDYAPTYIKILNLIVREDLTIPNPDEDTMREFVANITNNIHRAHRDGPKERAVDIVIKYYLHEYSIEDLTEMFNLSSGTIRMILRCWRDRCHTILGDPHSWDAPFSLGIYIFGNSPYNKEYPEFSFLHRIRFLMMHRAELSRADNMLLNRVLYTLKRYDSSCTVKKEENNE